MADLVLHQIDPELLSRLKERAARRGVEPEEEHLQILRNTLMPDDPIGSDQILKDLLFEMPDAGEDADFERIKEMPREVDLS